MIMRIRHFIFMILAGFLLLTGGCVTQQIPLYASSSSAAPVLSGKSVAVIPPFTSGAESKLAIDSANTMEAVFSGNIAGVDFKNCSSLLSLWQKQPGSYNLMRKAVTGRVPAGFKQVKSEVSGDTIKPPVFDSSTVAGKSRDFTYTLTFDTANSSSLYAEDQIDQALMTSCPADYVLVSAPFGEYLKHDSITALFGFLPFAGNDQMYVSPRGLFALYDGKTGKKVWEGQVGTATVFNPKMVPEIKGHVPMGSQVILGAAYLLTGNVEVPLDRILALSEAKL